MIRVVLLLLLGLGGCCRCLPRLTIEAESPTQLVWRPRTRAECLRGGQFQGYELRPPGAWDVTGCVPVSESPGLFCCPR